MNRFILYFIRICFLFRIISANNNVAYNIPDPDCTGVFNLCTDADKERLGRQAIKAIHEQMDDDKDGLIEASESQDFIHEELESKTDSVRHRRFQNADLQITFDDLWTQWQNNPVYNWTNDNVIDWLVNYVHLPIYAEYFRRNQIDGRMIPRLAANEKQYLSTIMQVRDLRHKRRLIIKATDIVLFGPPHRTHNYVKDVILISALLISIVACLYAFIRHRKTQESMNLMLKELETLQQAEGDLAAVTGKVKAMENELQAQTKVDRGLLNAWFIEVQRSKEEADKCRKRRDTTNDFDKQLQLAVQEIEQLRIALRKAEEHARHQSYEAPSELIDLLKRTYHIEEMAFETKRKLAENAMLTAKEQMSKISKMQKGFFGAVRIAHTGCMDNISELINAAKEKLAEVQEEYEEREKRWNRIASLLDRDDFLNNPSIEKTNFESLSRSKTISTELINTSNDSILVNRASSNLTSRPFDSDNGYDSNVKLRAINPVRLISNNSSNGESPESSSMKGSRSLFEGISDLPNDLYHVDSQQQFDRMSSNDDRISQSSPEKLRKQMISTKILKPFQNIRFRKKNSTTTNNNNNNN